MEHQIKCVGGKRTECWGQGFIFVKTIVHNCNNGVKLVVMIYVAQQHGEGAIVCFLNSTGFESIISGLVCVFVGGGVN